MMRLLVLLTVLLALTACKPVSPPAQGPVVLLVLEIDRETLRHDRLYDLSAAVREELRKQPMIVLSPVDGRKVEGDHLAIRLGKPEDSAAAIARIGRLAPADVPDSLAVSEASDGVIEVRFSEGSFKKLETDLSRSLVKSVERRLAGFRGASVEARGPSRIEARIPGLEDPDGDFVKLLTIAGRLSFHLVDDEANFADYRLGTESNGRIALRDDSGFALTQIVFAEPLLRGTDLSGASAMLDERNHPAIAFQLKPDGAERFGRATSENVGNFFAIVLDDRIISAPRIISPITGGSGQITGQFTQAEAERMAIILRSGALPARLKLLKSEVITVE